FPVIKDLVVDRGAFDRIIQAGGFITARTGSAPEANSLLVPKADADLAMDAAACIGCGACVAACPNASAMLFVAAKVSHLGLRPSLHGTPQYIPDSPYSPWSQAAQGRMRFLSCTMASTIWTTAAEGA